MTVLVWIVSIAVMRIAVMRIRRLGKDWCRGCRGCRLFYIGR